MADRLEPDVKFERDGRFLDHVDLIKDGVFTEVTLTVAAIMPRNHFEDEKEKTPIAHFALAFDETPKVLIMKATNGTLAKLVLGDCRQSQIKGKKLTLHPVYGKWSKGNYGIRIRYPNWKQHGIQPHHMGRDITGQKVEAVE